MLVHVEDALYGAWWGTCCRGGGGDTRKTFVSLFRRVDFLLLSRMAVGNTTMSIVRMPSTFWHRLVLVHDVKNFFLYTTVQRKIFT